MKVETELKTDTGYPFSLTQRVEGWAGSNFKCRVTRISARRVPGELDRPDVVQIEVSITSKSRANRMTQLTTSLELTPQEAEVLQHALMTDNERKDHALRSALCANAKKVTVR